MKSSGQARRHLLRVLAWRSGRLAEHAEYRGLTPNLLVCKDNHQRPSLLVSVKHIDFSHTIVLSEKRYSPVIFPSYTECSAHVSSLSISNVWDHRERSKLSFITLKFWEILTLDCFRVCYYTQRPERLPLRCRAAA